MGNGVDNVPSSRTLDRYIDTVHLYVSLLLVNNLNKPEDAPTP